MTKTITVNVTQEDIETGIANDCLHCPIALAISRELPSSFPKVRNSNAGLLGRFSGWADLPVQAQTFIELFDAGQSVAPITFDLTFDGFKILTNPSQPQA